MKRYALKGVNDDESVCAVCGKVELKRVMWLVEINADGVECGDVFPVGVVCGAKMLRLTTSKVSTKANSFAAYAKRVREGMMYSHPSWKERERLLKENAGIPFVKRVESGLLQKLTLLSTEARLWADSQPVLMQL